MEERELIGFSLFSHLLHKFPDLKRRIQKYLSLSLSLSLSRQGWAAAARRRGAAAGQERRRRAAGAAAARRRGDDGRRISACGRRSTSKVRENCLVEFYFKFPYVFWINSGIQLNCWFQFFPMNTIDYCFETLVSKSLKPIVSGNSFQVIASIDTSPEIHELFMISTIGCHYFEDIGCHFLDGYSTLTQKFRSLNSQYC